MRVVLSPSSTPGQPRPPLGHLRPCLRRYYLAHRLVSPPSPCLSTAEPCSTCRLPPCHLLTAAWPIARSHRHRGVSPLLLCPKPPPPPMLPIVVSSPLEPEAATTACSATNHPSPLLFCRDAYRTKPTALLHMPSVTITVRT
ncbi:hypothetical protein NL676_029160 [Syzygium grande]|nr:hypothetical protein NL676_029160 [Syzygium grande]